MKVLIFIIVFFLYSTICIASPVVECVNLVKNTERTVSDQDFSQAYDKCTLAIERTDDTEAFFWRGVITYKYTLVKFIIYKNLPASKGLHDLNRIVSMMNGAIKDFSTVISRKPTDYQAYANRGVLYGKLQLFDKAVGDLNTAISTNPDYEWAYMNRAVVYADMKSYSAALTDYEKAIQINPVFYEGYRARGVFYRYNLRDSCSAIDDYTKQYELEITPSSVSELAAVLLECGCVNETNGQLCNKVTRMAMDLYRQNLIIAPVGSFYWEEANRKINVR